MLMAIGALFAFCIGAMLAVIGDAVFLYEIFLPFILPGILLLLPIALLLHFAWKEQQCVSQKQQQIAESCYFETLTFCKAFQSREIFVRNLVKFIQQEVLPEGFAKRFIFAILTQAKPSLLAKKISLTKTSFDETIEKAFSHIQEGLYLSGQEKIDHENKLKE
ncbi:MAG: hypothetical protein IJ490_01030 [Chlamydia sp.]|nr:hypothetical protein [Chlamydia sp.]